MNGVEDYSSKTGGFHGLPILEDVFDVFGEVGVKERSRAGFFLMRSGDGDAGRDGAAHWLSRMKNSHGLRSLFDDDFRARTHLCLTGESAASGRC